MRVSLEIIDGPEVGRVIRVSAKEVRSIGRTDRADVALSADRGLSEEHFALETDGRYCRLRDLGSTNGTAVNGQLVGEQILSDGDRVAAGQTTFRVRIDGGADKAEVTAARSAAAATPAAIVAQAARAQKNLTYTAEDCQSGLRLFRGDAEKIAPQHVADVLARHVPAHLTVDWNKLAEDPPGEIAPAYLFDWLPPEAARAASPWIIAYAEFEGSFKLIEAAWGEDAIVCLFSKQDPQDLRTHLRREAQGGARSVVGICWPSVLAAMLTYSRPELVERLMTGIDAILVEFPDLPETWQLFARASFADVLSKAGFAEEQPTVAAKT